jgi:hypothetical protein
MRNYLAVVLALGTVVTVGRAQSMAEVTDQIMVMQMGMETDTMEMHTISAKGRSRADTHTRGGMIAQMWGSNSSQIMNSGDSAMGMIILNHDKKSYSTFNLAAMLDSSGNLFGGAGGSMKLDPTDDSSSVDSLGPGPVIAGHATLHYRTHSVMHMTMAFMGQNSTMRNEITSDLFVAPDIPTETDSSRSTRMQSLFGPGAMARAGSKIGRATSEVAKKGTTLRMITETVTHIGGMTQTQRMSMETLSYKKMVVPDSLFAIPAGYTKTEGLFGMPPG